jgi:serine/threonine-protein kinase
LRFTIPVGESQGGALLADGSGLVLTIRGPNRLSQLWERRWNDIELRPIAGTEGDLDATPAASPFSNEVAFVDGSTLKAVSLRGGAPRVLADSVDCCLFWGVDGYVYFVRTPGSRVFRVPEGGGTARLVEERPTWMLRVGADGDVTVRMTRTTPPRIQATSLTTGQTRILAEGSNPYLLPTGHLVYASPDGKILAARFDAASLSFVRDPIPIVEGVSVNAGGVASYEVSASGTMLHVASTPQDGAWELVWMTRGGLATQVDPGWIFVPGTGNASWALSPDGSRVAYRARTDAGFDIWVKDLPSGPPTRLTLDPGEEADPRWTADGDRVTFVSDRGGNLDLWSARADGADAPVLVHDHPTPLAEGFVSPDGAWTVVRLGATADNPGARDILFASRGSIPRVLSANAAYAEERPTLSPDGRWIAYTSDESGRREVYVRPFPDVQAGKVQVSRNGGGAPVWSRTGEELYYVEPGPPTLMSTQLDPANGMRVDGAERLFAFPANHFADRYDVAPDGRFLVGRAVPREREIVITVNFMSELEQLVP